MAEEKKGFFAAFTANHVAATLVAATFAVAGLAALLDTSEFADLVAYLRSLR